MKNIPQDDLIDIVELSNKIHRLTLRSVKNFDNQIQKSAVLSAFTHSILDICETLEEVYYFVEIFIDFLTECIKRSKNKEN